LGIPEPYDELVLKSLQNDISAEEKASLDAWMNQSPDNVRIFKQYVSLWKSTNIDESQMDFQTSAEWKKLQHVIRPEAPAISIPKWRNIYKMAAAVALIALGSFVIYQQLRGKRQTEIVGVDATTNVMLPDGSTCTLQKGAVIRYVESFDDERILSLSGRAFFSVIRDPSKPFVVTTAFATVTVLGTSFNVDANSKDSLTEVFVATGKVRVAEINNDSNHIVVEPGQLAILSNNSKKIATRSSDNENPLAWKDHKLVFRKAPMQKVINTVQDYFGVKINIRNPDLLRCHFTSAFTDPSIEEVMETLQETLHLSISKQNKDYEIDGNGCY
jgi:ferric-dicitrate binding protein FerR (iron transport regulator)